MHFLDLALEISIGSLALVRPLDGVTLEDCTVRRVTPLLGARSSLKRLKAKTDLGKSHSGPDRLFDWEGPIALHSDAIFGLTHDVLEKLEVCAAQLLDGYSLVPTHRWGQVRIEEQVCPALEHVVCD